MNARKLLAAVLVCAACATPGATNDATKAMHDAELKALADAETKAGQASVATKARLAAQAKEAEEEAAEKARALAAMLPGEAVLSQRPAIAPLEAFEAPVPKETQLQNGLRLLVVEKAGAPIEALLLVTRRGSAADPEGKGGLASLTAAMLEAGSAKKSQAEIAALADAMGAALRTSATADGLVVSVSAQPANLAAMGQLLADVALRPNFDAAEWKKVKAQRLAQLQEQLAEPRVAAQNAQLAALYGTAPLGHPVTGTPASVEKTALADVKALWASLDPGEVALIAVGQATEAEVVQALAARFSAWKPAKKPAAAREQAADRAPGDKGGAPGGPAAAQDARPRLVLVEFPGRPQTVLRVGQPSVPLSSPDSLALRVMNSVLGGSFTSRLNQNLREKNGYSYGAGSSFAFGRGPGPFTASTSVKTEVTGLALGELLKELALVVDAPLSTEEVEKGKALLAYQLVEQLQRADFTAGLVGELLLADVPLDELRTRLPRLKALGAAQVQAAARRSLDPKSMTITVAGDAKVLAQFEKLGLPPPQRRDATGNKL